LNDRIEKRSITYPDAGKLLYTKTETGMPTHGPFHHRISQKSRSYVPGKKNPDCVSTVRLIFKF